MEEIIWDTETTGLPKPSAASLLLQPKIIEIAAIKICNKTFKIIDQIEMLINPQLPLEAIITKITGLKDADLAGKPTFPECVDEIAEFFNGAQRIIAHNAEFDRTLMYFELMRLGWENGFTNCYAESCCTVEATFHLKNKRLKMTELYELAFERPLMQTHRAMDDVMALYECRKWIHEQGIPL